MNQHRCGGVALLRASRTTGPGGVMGSGVLNSGVGKILAAEAEWGKVFLVLAFMPLPAPQMKSWQEAAEDDCDQSLQRKDKEI